jgi:hypothetical protein
MPRADAYQQPHTMYVCVYVCMFVCVYVHLLRHPERHLCAPYHQVNLVALVLPTTGQRLGQSLRERRARQSVEGLGTSPGAVDRGQHSRQHLEVVPDQIRGWLGAHGAVSDTHAAGSQSSLCAFAAGYEGVAAELDAAA